MAGALNHADYHLNLPSPSFWYPIHHPWGLLGNMVRLCILFQMCRFSSSLSIDAKCASGPP